VTDSSQNTRQTRCKLLPPKPFDLVSFSVASNVPSQQSFVLPALVPATRYALRVSARNPAGTTVAQYVFATRSTAPGLCFCTPIVKPNYNVCICTLFILLSLWNFLITNSMNLPAMYSVPNTVLTIGVMWAMCLVTFYVQVIIWHSVCRAE